MYRFAPILARLIDQVQASLDRQVSGGEADGCFLTSETGFPSADHTGHARDLAALAQAYLTEGSPLAGDPALGHRLKRACAFFQRWQRPSGCIDLPKVDPDSPPDTAFAVQLLACQLDHARRRAGDGFTPAGWVAEVLEGIVERAARGIIGRGFRTPNHRWVVVSALAQALALMPGLRAEALPYIERILAEGIDINADGEFSERSTGIYTAVCCRALRYAADHLGRPDLLDHVRSNLRFTACLLEEDATIITAISGRQDRGGRQVPLTMADSLFDMAQREGNGEWAALADRIVEHGVHRKHPVEGLGWLLQPFLDTPAYRQESLPRRQPPARGEWFFPDSRLWFLRDAELTAFAAAHTRIPFALRCGAAELRSLRCATSYFNHTSLIADHAEAIPGGVRLVHRAKPARWDLPLGRPLPFRAPHEYYAVAETQRDHHDLPALGLSAEIVRREDVIAVTLRSHGGLDRIPVQVELSFNGPGEWIVPGHILRAEAGGAVQLQDGAGIFRRGDHAIRVQAQGGAHRWWQLPQLDADHEGFRVLVNLCTPVDHTILLTPGRWSPARPDTVEALAGATDLVHQR